MNTSAFAQKPLASVADRFTEHLVRMAEQHIPRGLDGQLERPLYFVRGKGQQTYHRDAPDRHRITLGREMVRQHLIGDVSRWLHVRERERLGWDRAPSMADLVCHVILHETAHAIQCEQGGRQRGSVHNDAFYAILSELPHARWAQALQQAVRDHYPEEGAQTMQSGNPAGNRSAEAPALDAVAIRRQVPPHRTYQFWHKGRRFVGTVIRYNARTITLVGNLDNGRRSKMRVPYSMAGRLEALPI